MAMLANKLESIQIQNDRTERNIRPHGREGDNIIISTNKLRIRETCEVQSKLATGFILGLGNNQLGTTLLGSNSYTTVETFNSGIELTDKGKRLIASLLKDSSGDKPAKFMVGNDDLFYVSSQTSIAGDIIFEEDISGTRTDNVLVFENELNATDSINQTIKEYAYYGSFITLSDCDSITGWTNDGVADTPTLNTITKKEGSASLNILKSNTTDVSVVYYKNITTQDATGKKIMVWFFIKDQTNMDKIDSKVTVSLGSGSGSEIRSFDFLKTNLNIGWNLLECDTTTVVSSSGQAFDATFDWTF